MPPYFTVKSMLCVCALEASNVHIILMEVGCWTRIDFQTICDVTNPDRIGFSVSIHFPLSADESDRGTTESLVSI